MAELSMVYEMLELTATLQAEQTWFQFTWYRFTLPILPEALLQGINTEYYQSCQEIIII